ncbi:MAG: translocation/assembly module TamB domain-containing protein [Myxococcota bacterium]
MGKRVAGGLLRALLLGVLAVASLLGSVTLHGRTRVFRRLARAQLDPLISAQMAGTLRLGEIVELTPWGLRARGVEVDDPQGRRVIRGEEVRVVLDPWALRSLSLHFTHARIRGGELVLHEDEPGDPSFLRAFGAPLNADPTSESGLGAIVDDWHIEDLVVRGTLLGLRNLRLEDTQVHLRLAIAAESAFPIDLRVFSASGTLVSPVAHPVRLENLVARVRDDPALGSTLWARLASEGAATPERLTATLSYVQPEGAAAGAEEELDLRLYLDPVHTETVADAGADFLAPFRGAVRGQLRLAGPTDDLRMTGRLDTAGGPLGLRAGLPSEGPTDLDLDLSGLRLDAVLRDAEGLPALPVEGSLRLRVPEAGPVALELETPPLRLFGLAIPALRLRGTLDDDDRLRIEEAELSLESGRVRVAGVVDEGRAILDVDARADRLQSEPIVRSLAPGLAGALDGRGRVEVPLDGGSAAVRGRWVFTNVRYGTLRVARAVATGRIAGSDLARPDLDLDLEIRGASAGGVPLGDGTGRIAGSPTGYDSELALASEVRRLGITGRLALTERGLRASFPRVTLARRDGRGWLPLSGGLAVLLVDGDRVRMEGAALEGPDGAMRAGGTVRIAGDAPPEALSLDVDGLDLSSLAAWTGLAELEGLGGILTGAATLEAAPLAGPARSRVQAELTLSDGRAGTVEGVDANLLFEIAEGRLRADLDASRREGPGRIDGTLEGFLPDEGTLLDALPRATYTLDASVRDVDLARAAALAGVPDQVRAGVGSLELNASGDLSVFDFTLRASVPTLELADPGLPRLGGDVRARFRGGTLSTRLVVQDDAGTLVEGEGSIATIDPVALLQHPERIADTLQTQIWRLALLVPQRPLASLPELIRDALPGADALVGSATLSLAGGALRTRADLVTTLAYDGDLEETCGTPSRPRAVLRGTLRDTRLDIAVRGFAGGRPVLEGAFESELPLDDWIAGGAAEVPVTEGALRLVGAEAEALPGLCRVLSGPLDGELLVDALFSDAPRFALQARSDGLRLRRLAVRGRGESARLELAESTEPLTLALELELDDDWVRGGAVAGFGDEGQLDLRGTLPVLSSHEGITIDESRTTFVDARFREVPLAVPLFSVASLGEVGGVLDGVVTASGPGLRPSLAGELRLSRGRSALVDIGQRLEDVEGRLVFSDDHIALQGLRARDGDGLARVAGEVLMRGFLPTGLDLRLDADAFPVRDEGSIVARITGAADLRAALSLDLGLDADVSGSRLKGELIVDRLTVAIPEGESRSPQELVPHPDVRVLGQEPARPAGEPFLVSLRVLAEDPIEVRSSAFDATARAALDVLVREPDFRVAGVASVEGGTFEIFSSRFTVQRGALRFDGGPAIDPLVNLVAVHELISRPGETVTITASGRLSDPQVTFASTLTNDPVQVITLLVGGDVTDEGQAEAQDQTQSFLLGVAAGVLTLSLRDELGGFFPQVGLQLDGDGTTRVSTRVSFDEQLPERLRRIVRAVYLEGFFFSESTEGSAGANQSGLGFVLEVLFPRSIVNTNTVTTQGTNFSVDVTWQP